MASDDPRSALGDLRDAVDRLNANLVKFTESSDRYARRLVVLTGALIGLTLLLILLAVVTIEDSRHSVASQNNIALNALLYTPRNVELMRAIEAKKPILEKDDGSGGKFTIGELDAYLGTFDVIEAVYARRLLSMSDLCALFSYYIEVTNEHPEVREYIAEERKADAGFFSGFLELAQVVSKSKDDNCHRDTSGKPRRGKT